MNNNQNGVDEMSSGNNNNTQLSPFARAVLKITETKFLGVAYGKYADELGAEGYVVIPEKGDADALPA